MIQFETRHSPIFCDVTRAAPPLSERTVAMAWLRRIGGLMCGAGRRVEIGSDECALAMSAVLGERHGSPTIVAVGRSLIYWLDLGASRGAKCSASGSRPHVGTLPRNSADGGEIEARLTSIRQARILTEDLTVVHTHSPTPSEIVYAAGPLLRWLLALPREDDSQFEWLSRLVARTAIERGPTESLVFALTRTVTRVPQFVALHRFAVLRGVDRHELFRSEFVRAIDRVAEFADPCDVAALPDRLVAIGMEPHLMRAAVQRLDGLDWRHLALALILGGNASYDLMDHLPTGTVLEATRAAMDRCQAVVLQILAHTSLAAPLARLVCEMAFALPALAAEAVSVPVARPGEVLRTSTCPPHLFTTTNISHSQVMLSDSGNVTHAVERAIFTYPDGAAASVLLTISESEQTLQHHRASGIAEASVEVVDFRPVNSTRSYVVRSWSELYGLAIRDCLDSLFDDSHENRTFFVGSHLRETYRAEDDRTIRSRQVSRLLSRFGADCVASAVLKLEDNLGALADVLVLGVSPNHPRFRALPWRMVRRAVAGAHAAGGRGRGCP